MQKQEKNPDLFHQANIHACFIRVLLALPLPDIQIPLLDGITYQRWLIKIKEILLRRSWCVCGGGGGGVGAGYVKIVMTGMCGPNLASALVDVCVWGRGWHRKIVMTGMCGPNFSYKLT